MGSLCHPCNWAYVRRQLAVSEAMAQLADPSTTDDLTSQIASFKNLLTRMVVCTTDLEDKLCMPQLRNYDWSADFLDATGPKCASIDAFHAEVGCCANTLLNLHESQCIDNALDDTAKADCSSDIRSKKIDIKNACGSKWVATDVRTFLLCACVVRAERVWLSLRDATWRSSSLKAKQ